jgi:hypothetical protein
MSVERTYITRNPPYDYVYNWQKAEGGAARVDDPADQVSTVHTGTLLSRDGHAEFSLFSGGGTAVVMRGVGVFYRPPPFNRHRTLYAHSLPKCRYYYSNSGFYENILNNAIWGTWIFQYNISDNSFDGLAGAMRFWIFNRNTFWLIGGEHNYDRVDAAQFVGAAHMDANHWYAIWIGCSAESQGSSCASGVSMDVPSIRLTDDAW